MRTGYAVEQVFLRLSKGGLELSFVLLAVSGALKHETMRFATKNEREVVTRAARFLAARGDVDSADSLRFRVERGGRLKDDASLKTLFTKTFNQELDL